MKSLFIDFEPEFTAVVFENEEANQFHKTYLPTVYKNDMTTTDLDRGIGELMRTFRTEFEDGYIFTNDPSIAEYLENCYEASIRDKIKSIWTAMMDDIKTKNKNKVLVQDF